MKKIKLLKIQVRSAQNVGKVWISRKQILPAPFGAILGHFFHGPEKSKKYTKFAYFPWWANGPYSPGLGPFTNLPGWRGGVVALADSSHGKPDTSIHSWQRTRITTHERIRVSDFANFSMETHIPNSSGIWHGKYMPILCQEFWICPNPCVKDFRILKKILFWTYPNPCVKDFRILDLPEPLRQRFQNFGPTGAICNSGI